MEVQVNQTDEEEEGVLLYYQYVDIPDTESLLHWFRDDCSALGLVGRVRIAPDGVNVTVGGKMTSLEKHIGAVSLNALFKGCDFKLASCQGQLDERIAKECGFTSLSVRAVKVAETRFASHTIVMRRLLKVKDALSQMVIGHQWGVWKISNSERAQRIRDLILNESWWARVAYVLDFTEPIMTMLRFADTDTPCLGDVYDGMDTMVEKVKHSIQTHESDPTQCEALCIQVQAIINHRWNKMTTPLHLLAYALSPRYYSEEIAGMPGRVAPFADEEVAEGCHKALSRLVPLEEMHEKVREEFGLFASGLKHSPFALKDQNRMGAITWWYMYGQPFKHLQPLAIKVLSQEVVSLVACPLVRSPSISNAGKHLSAIEFHSILQMAGGLLQEDCDLNRYHINNSLDFLASQLECETGDHQHHRGIVLLDARNMYETRIGKFLPPGQIQTLDPKIRQYSDLPAWIDSHEEQLCGNNILMYCTGGVRCEMASAYIRTKGSGYENVYQLSGGIQRYLEVYPNGGFFKGKNFVFDPRISVGSTDTGVIGSCLLCGESFDDYSSRSRCSYCRMLVLVCNACQELSTLNKENSTYLCELCRKNDPYLSKHCGESNTNFLKGSSRTEEVEFVAMRKHESVELTDGLEQSVEPCRPDELIGGRMDAAVIKGPSTRKLKILCLHGFRQNASSLKGRLASFVKKLKHLAEFVFVDAPHEVPFIYQTFRNQTRNGRDNDETLEGSTDSVNYSQSKFSLPHNCKKKYAWLVAPNCYNTNLPSCPASITFESRMTAQELLEHDNSKSEETKWIEATSPFDPLQYQQQTAGWPETILHLQNIFSDMGPFDGVLGFSQGASIAATLCTQSQDNPGVYGNIDFKFAILCSGFPSPAEEFQQFISNPDFSSIDCPSLHIFGGNAGLDRQIMSDTSMQLASLFRSDNRVVVRHPSGHIVPAQSPYIDKIKEFLIRFV